jgi:hypothetical protein
MVYNYLIDECLRFIKNIVHIVNLQSLDHFLCEFLVY